MNNQKYWILGELNIIKKDENSFELIGGNGSLLDLDREAAIAVLSLNGEASLDRWQEDLKEHDIKAKSSELEKLLFLLSKNGLVEVKDIKLEKMNYKKVIQNIDKFKKGPVGISNVTISVTYECPYSCIYCLRYPIKVGKPIEAKYVEDAINDIGELGGRLLTLTGGEPELESQLLKRYVKAARNAEIQSISLATRGYTITEDLLEDLKEEGLTDVVISLDSSNELQDKISGYKGAFKIATSAIETSKRVGLRTSINFTCYGPNISEIKPTAELAKKYEVRMKVTPYILRNNLAPLTVEETKEIERILKFLEQEGMPVSCLSLKEKAASYDTPMICEAGISRAHIEVDGNVSGCQFIAYSPKAIVGNIKDSFLNIWLNGDWSFYRDAEPINEKCGSCDDRKYCVRNCLAVADALYNEPKMINIPKCKNK
jgi:radical SAM protein with 4Fe4S-binding SPASM domain